MRIGAHHRYLVANWLLITGLSALVVTFPLGIVTWGRPYGAVVIFTLGYGMMAVILAAILGIFNLLALRKNPERSQVTRTFE